MKRINWFLLRSQLMVTLTFPLLWLGVSFLCLFIFQQHAAPTPWLLSSMAISAALISTIIVKRLHKRLSAAQLLDTPNHRSMHAQPIPRGGGWAFVMLAVAMQLLSLATILGVGINTATSGLIQKLFPDAALLFGILLLAWISWRDDCGGVAARWRLLAQFIAVAPVLILALPQLASAFPPWFPLWLLFPALLIGWVGFINLYNFMDGIDGITGVETFALTGGIIVVLAVGGQHFAAADLKIFSMPLVLAGASIGFLFHNWHPAKIFLGDVGSVVIGFLIGFGLLALVQAGHWYAALTLPLYYLADAGITLGRRLLRGEEIWQAHREHFYQRAAQAAGRHDGVVKKIALCNLALISLAVLQLLYSPWLVLAAPLPVGLLLHNLGRQRHSIP